MKTYFEAYKGNGRYAFVSYSHTDSDMVYPVICDLHNEGYNIWYDEGIAPSAEWRGVINEHIRDCEVFVVFATKNSMDSVEVVKECTYAINLHKKLHIIYLEEIPDSAISPNLIADFTNNQRVHAHEMHSNVFAKRLREPLAGCRDIIEPEIPADNEDKPEKENVSNSDGDGGFSLLKAWKAARPSYRNAFIRVILLIISTLLLPLNLILWGGEKTESASGIVVLTSLVGIICLIPLIMWKNKTKYGQNAVLSSDKLQSGFMSETIWTAVSRVVITPWAMLLYTIGATVFMSVDAWFSDLWPILVIMILTDFASVIFSVTPRIMLNSMFKEKKEVSAVPLKWHRVFCVTEIINIVKAGLIALCGYVIYDAEIYDRMFSAYDNNIIWVAELWGEAQALMWIAAFTAIVRIIMLFHEKAFFGLGKSLINEK